MPKHTSKPKRSNNSISCNLCRERHRKCDGVPPRQAMNEVPSQSCSLCTRAMLECQWSGEQDHRSPPTHGQIETLQACVDVLDTQVRGYQKRLRDNGLSTELEDNADVADPNSDALSDGEPSDGDDMTGSFGRLVIDNKTTTYYGGPAPFRDLPSQEESALPNPSSPLNTNIRYSLWKSPSDVEALDSRLASAWHQFLPSGIELNLSRLEHDLVLAQYFRYYSSWNFRVIPGLFLRDFALAISPQTRNPGSGARSPFRHYSTLFHNAILAVALAYSDDVQHRSREFRNRFAQHAKSLLEEECRAPSLATVQGLGILSSYHSGLSEPGLGFMYFGISVRMGQALGLNVWIRNGAMSNQDVVERNWVSWSLFCQDKCWSFEVGRDQGLRDCHFDIPEPQVDPVPRSDSMLDADTLDGGTNTTSVSRASDMFVNFLWQVKLMKIASSIMDVVYCMTPGSRRSIDFEKVARLRLVLVNWERTLPKNLRISPKGLSACLSPPEVFMLNLAYHWLLILLLRPFFKPDTKIQSPASSGEPPLNGTSTRRRKSILLTLREAAKKTCPASANHIVALFRAYRGLYTLRLSNVTAVQIAYTTGKTHFLTMVASGPNDSSRARKAREGFQECVQILKEMGESWASGRFMARILQGLLRGGEEPVPQNMNPAPPLVVQVYEPPPYPPPARSSGIPPSAPVTNLIEFRHPVDEFRAPLERPSYLDQPNHQLPTEDYQGPSIQFLNSYPSTDNPGALNPMAHEQQEQEQPTASGGNSSAPSGPPHNQYLGPSPGNFQFSSPFGYVWQPPFSLVPTGTPCEPDAQTPFWPTSGGNISLLGNMALQPLGMDENNHQDSNQFALDYLGLQNPGRSTERGWPPS